MKEGRLVQFEVNCAGKIVLIIGSTQRESLATKKLDSLECVPKPA